MKLRTLATTAVIGLSAVTAGMAQDVSGRSLLLRGGNTTAANIGTLTVTALTAPRTYTFPDATGTVLLSSGGTLNQLTRFGAGGAIVDGSLSDNGTGTLTRAGNISLNPGVGNFLTTDGHASVDGDLIVGTGASAVGGTIFLYDNTAGGANNGALSGPVLYTASRTYTLPDASGTILLGSTGTANQMTRWGAGGTSLVDASLSDDGAGTLVRAGNINLNTGAANTLSTDGNAAINGDVTLGTAAVAGGSIVWNDNTAGASFSGTMQGPLLYTAARTYTLPDADGTFLMSTGGTANQMTRWGAGGTSLVDASLSDNGTGTLARAGSVAINTGAANTLSTDGNASIDGDLTIGTAAVAGGSIVLNDNTAGASFSGTMQGPALYTAARTYTLPDATGTILLGSTGTANQMTRWGAGGTSLVDASLSDDGAGTLAYAGNINLNTGAANTLATNGSFTVNGTTTLGDADADVTTARGTINLNTTNTAGATVNISTSAQANTTNIGSSTLNNVTNITGNAAGAALTLVNANGAAGIGLSITDAFTTGLSIGTTTPPASGIIVNAGTTGISVGPTTTPTTGLIVKAGTTGISVNTGAGADLTINEDAIARTATDIAVNPGAANKVTTNGGLQVDGNTTLGAAATNTTTINGIVKGAGANRFADRVDISLADGDGLITIANTAVAAGAVIIVTVESPAADATVYTMKVQNVVAATSFDVQFAGGALAAAANRFLNYIIINP